MRDSPEVTIRALTRVAVAFTLMQQLGAVAAIGQTPAATTPARLSLAEAREGIVAATKRWDQARLALDTAALSRALLPEFSAVISPMNADSRLARAEFLAAILTPPAGPRLTRFDSSILTVIRTPTGFETVVQEKLEFTGQNSAGADTRQYALWVTRDGWRQVDGEWRLASSVAIGMQGWNAPTRPPFADW